MYLSIVIPSYNEQDRIIASLDKIELYLAAQSYASEIILIDDGSTDKTLKLVESYKLKNNRLVVLQNPRNMGKGFSVKKGILAARGEMVLFSDADLSTPIDEIEKLMITIESGYQIAIGSRSIEGAEIKVHQPFYREYMGKFFNFLVQTLILKGIVDTQCGFKLFKGRIAKEIASQVKLDGFSFDVEMLYLARKMGYRVKEVPIVWINSPGSRVNPVRDSCKMFFELLSIRRLHNEAKK